jgi:hypothetical protein
MKDILVRQGQLSSARIQKSSFEYYGRKCFKLALFLSQQTLDSDWSMELQVYYINVDIYAE